MALLMPACATKTLSIKSSEGATVSLASFDDLTRDQKVLGKVPVDVPVSDVIGKAIRVSSDGKKTVYWLIAEASGD